MGQKEEIQQFSKEFLWPIEKMNTNAAYQLATQWLTAVGMDVKALNRDFPVFIKINEDYFTAPSGKFAPVYSVGWCKKFKPIPGVVFTDKKEWEPVASVRLLAPTKTLLQLRVEDPKYILRDPIVFTNLAELLLQTNSPVLNGP